MSTFMKVWDPYRDLENIQKRFFGNLERDANFERSWTPSVDVAEDDKSYFVHVEIPGVSKQDVQVKIEDNQLVISGERKTEKEHKERKFSRIERQFGSFIRSFTLPDDVKASEVNAEFKDGVLSVLIPKTEAAQPRLVDIKIN